MRDYDYDHEAVEEWEDEYWDSLDDMEDEWETEENYYDEDEDEDDYGF